MGVASVGGVAGTCMVGDRECGEEIGGDGVAGGDEDDGEE